MDITETWVNRGNYRETKIMTQPVSPLSDGEILVAINKYAMLGFQKEKTFQKSTSTHVQIYTHINGEQHLVNRQTFKEFRPAAIAEWRSIIAKIIWP
ncbi:MAG: hypothetical protein COB54_02220 [Alphaproteobacteria bacterium]|nr:MAG: hypothetical protein COB54_02220 [Alphaproteobacteria bacterium]